jgi:protein gp37
MNKTRIEWCTHTWNPVTGCWGPGGTVEAPKLCWYCYAWVQSLIDQARGAGVPVFLKDNLNWPEQIREWPE